MTKKNFANVMYRVFYCIEVEFGYQQYMCKRKTRSNRNMNLKRRLLRISQIEKKNNAEIFQQTREERVLPAILKSRSE